MAERLEFKGDYMGFTYNGVHSSELGIVRTSDGSRFNENLLPTMQDKTVQVPGGDGTYYFGSYYTQRQFSVSFAFDSLTETEVARIKRHFGDKKIHDLIFDETPYKVWSAKVTGTATIKYVPFNEGSIHRLYKGEGSIQFTCYYPFARCWSTNKEDYKNHPAYLIKEEGKDPYLCKDFEKRIAEWWSASGLKEEQGNYDTYDPTTGEIKLYNPGDKESECILKLYFSDYKKWSYIPAGSFTINDKTLSWNEIKQQGDDTFLIFDSKSKIIFGAKGKAQNPKTGTIYNQYIESGDFFTIPKGESTLVVSESARPSSGEYRVHINYNYNYL